MHIKIKFFLFVFLVSYIQLQTTALAVPEGSLTSFASLQDSLSDSTDEFGEFKPFNENESKSEKQDEFKAFDEDELLTPVEDELKKYRETGHTRTRARAKQYINKNKAGRKELYWVLGILLTTVLTGVLVRFRFTRNFRNLFLLTSLIVLGFSGLHHACPCMLSSFQDTLLVLFGYDVNWQKMIWFTGLIPVTYFFGKVWCGWLCHLGALQEFVYLPARFNVFRGRKAMKIMKIIRWSLLALLIVQLAIEGRIFFCKIDPFKTIFDIGILGSKYLVTKWILVGLLLATSLFSYRPFCKSACPVGLMLGFVAKIPGASVIGLKGECSQCKICNNACNQDAIIQKNKYSILNNQDCIACGDCIDACKKHRLGFFRKNKNHDTIVHCKSEYEI